jgi:hypothetical protein
MVWRKGNVWRMESKILHPGAYTLNLADAVYFCEPAKPCVKYPHDLRADDELAKRYDPIKIFKEIKIIGHEKKDEKDCTVVELSAPAVEFSYKTRIWIWDDKGLVARIEPLINPAWKTDDSFTSVYENKNFSFADIPDNLMSAPTETKGQTSRQRQVADELNAKWRVYRNKEWAFQVEIPATWNVHESPNSFGVDFAPPRRTGQYRLSMHKSLATNSVIEQGAKGKLSSKDEMGYVFSETRIDGHRAFRAENSSRYAKQIDYYVSVPSGYYGLLTTVNNNDWAKFQPILSKILQTLKFDSKP